MKKVIEIKTEFRIWTFMINPQRIDLISGDYKFFAEYPFLNNNTGYLTDVNPSMFHLMLYVLLYGLEKVHLPKPELMNPGNILVSYSGGVDSTATLWYTKGVPVHITRSYDAVYESRQIRACNYVNAFQITTDFERVRQIYITRHGFNVGIGYISMYLPILNLIGCSTVALGTILEGIAFHSGDEFFFNESYTNSNSFKIIKELKKFGINIILPLAGHSEVLTIDMAAKSGIKHYSSCHTIGNEDSCRNCFKCFRKEAICGNPLEWDKIKNKIIPFLKKKPLTAASSTVYAIQRANYKNTIFDRYKDIDVSFCERVNMSLTELFSNDMNVLYPFQTAEDINHIKDFAQFINDPEIYNF
jgi:hypothetical protein